MAIALPQRLIRLLALIETIRLITAVGGDCSTESLQGETVTPSYVLETIRVEGNAKTSEAFILGELFMRTGEAFSDLLAKASKIRLLGLGLFDKVDMRLEKGSVRGAITWIIEVRERQTFVLERAFMGLYNERRTYLGATFSQLNLFGSGQRGSVSAAIRDGRSGGIALSWTHPNLPANAWMLSVTGLLSQSDDSFEDELEDYRLDHRRYEFQLKLAKRRNEFLTFSGELKMRYIRILNRSRGRWLEFMDIVGDEEYQTAFCCEVAWDTRNNYFLPDRGGALKLRAEFGEPLNSQAEYSRSELLALLYLPLTKDNYLSIRHQIGYCTGATPFMFRFYRSEALRGFGPSPFLGVTFQEETPRDTSISLSLELHAPFRTNAITKPIQAEFFVFTDLGSIFDRELIDESELSLSIGAGFRFNTDFGVLSFYLGYPVKE